MAGPPQPQRSGKGATYRSSTDTGTVRRWCLPCADPDFRPFGRRFAFRLRRENGAVCRFRARRASSNSFWSRSFSRCNRSFFSRSRSTSSNARSNSALATNSSVSPLHCDERFGCPRWYVPIIYHEGRATLPESSELSHSSFPQPWIYRALVAVNTDMQTSGIVITIVPLIIKERSNHARKGLRSILNLYGIDSAEII